MLSSTVYRFDVHVFPCIITILTVLIIVAGGSHTVSDSRKEIRISRCRSIKAMMYPPQRQFRRNTWKPLIYSTINGPKQNGRLLPIRRQKLRMARTRRNPPSTTRPKSRRTKTSNERNPSRNSTGGDENPLPKGNPPGPHDPNPRRFTIEARIYRPSSKPASQKLPIYVHFHGGGFFFGTLGSEDATCSRLAIM